MPPAPAGLPEGAPAEVSRVAPAIAARTTTPRADRHGVSRSRRWRRESGKEYCKQQRESRSLIGWEKECGVSAAAEKKVKLNVSTTVTPLAAVPPTYLYVDRFFKRCSS